MRKLLLFLIKYIPIVQAIGMLLNNTLYLLDKFYYFTRIMDCITGNSLLMFMLLITCSYIFKFCIWHKTLTVGNFINVLITTTYYIFIDNEAYFTIPILTISFCVLTILISMYFKFCNYEQESNKVTSI